MTKYRQEIEGEDGWSRDIAPQMKGYKMACCDCGLVHDIDFRVVKVAKTYEDGGWDAEDVDDSEYRVIMKARRNNRATGQVRRHKK